MQKEEETDSEIEPTMTIDNATLVAAAEKVLEVLLFTRGHSLQFYERGFAVIPNFLTTEEVDAMKGAMHKIIEEMDLNEHPHSIFSTEDVDRVEFFWCFSPLQKPSTARK